MRLSERMKDSDTDTRRSRAYLHHTPHGETLLVTILSLSRVGDDPPVPPSGSRIVRQAGPPDVTVVIARVVGGEGRDPGGADSIAASPLLEARLAMPLRDHLLRQPCTDKWAEDARWL